MNETVETRERFFDAAHLRSLLIKPRILRNYIQESFRITRASLGDIVIVNGLFTVLLTVVYFALVPVVFQLSYIRQYQNFLLGLIGSVTGNPQSSNPAYSEVATRSVRRRSVAILAPRPRPRPAYEPTNSPCLPALLRGPGCCFEAVVIT